MNRVEKHILHLDFKHVDEFCKVAVRATPESKFVFIHYEKGNVSIFAEDYSGSVNMTQPVEGNSVEFSAGFDFNTFISVFKKFYDGEVKFTFQKSRVHVKLDNIKATLPVVSPKRRPNNVKVFAMVSDSRKDRLIANLGKCLAIESPTKVAHKFLGILLDNTEKDLRICNFDAASVYFSVIDRVFNGAYRVVVSNLFAKCAKSLDKMVTEVLFSDNQIGLKYQHGTVSFAAYMSDSYPQEYVSMWGLPDDYSKFANSEYSKCKFEKESLFNAVELISSILGDDDNWLHFETVGEAEGCLVWRLSGASYSGKKIEEKILSSKGLDVEPFKVHKKSLLKCLGVYEEDLYMVDLSPSVAVFTDEFGRITLISKAKV